VLDAGTAIGNNTYIKLESKVNIMIKLATLKMTLATTFIATLKSATTCMYVLAVRVLDAGTAIGNNMAININFIFEAVCPNTELVNYRTYCPGGQNI
jgi:hypothetical protein